MKPTHWLLRCAFLLAPACFAAAPPPVVNPVQTRPLTAAPLDSVPVTINVQVDLTGVNPLVTKAGIQCLAMAVPGSLASATQANLNKMGAATHSPTSGGGPDTVWNSAWAQISTAAGFSVNVPVYYQSGAYVEFDVTNAEVHRSVSLSATLPQAELLDPSTKQLMTSPFLAVACRLKLGGQTAVFKPGPMQLATTSNLGVLASGGSVWTYLEPIPGL